MNFSYGIIALVGILAAISIGFISLDPYDIIEPRTIRAEPAVEPEPTMAVSNMASTVTPTVNIATGSAAPGCEETNECYLPYLITINVGETVQWNNSDSAAHTVTSGDLSDGADGIFDSGLFISGGTFEFTFDDAGTYDYFCVVHPWMSGQITVN